MAFILKIAILFFIANQCVEYAILHINNLPYTDLCRWDVSWYASIVRGGYALTPNGHEKMDAANWAFFPLLPMAAKLIKSLLHCSEYIALIITSRIFFFLAIASFIQFGLMYSELNPLALAFIVSFNPYAFYYGVGMTEGPFLFFSTLFFIVLKKDDYLKCGIVGIFLTATRNVGCVFLLAYLFKALKNIRQGCIQYKILGLLLFPLGITSYMAYLYFLTGDALAFVHIQRAWGRSIGNPLVVLYNGFISASVADKFFCFITIAAFISVVYFLYKKQYELSIVAFALTLIPLSTSLISMQRYTFGQATFLLFLAEVFFRKKYCWIIFAPISIALYIFLLLSWAKGMEAHSAILFVM